VAGANDDDVVILLHCIDCNAGGFWSRASPEFPLEFRTSSFSSCGSIIIEESFCLSGAA
jgi:hypothetical protein